MALRGASTALAGTPFNSPSERGRERIAPSERGRERICPLRAGEGKDCPSERAQKKGCRLEEWEGNDGGGAMDSNECSHAKGTRMLQLSAYLAVRITHALGEQSQDVILKRLCRVVWLVFPAPLVQRPSTSAFQVGDHGFESRTGYQSSVLGAVRLIAYIGLPHRGVDEPRGYG